MFGNNEKQNRIQVNYVSKHSKYYSYFFVKLVCYVNFNYFNNFYPMRVKINTTFRKYVLRIFYIFWLNFTAYSFA